MTGCSNIYVSYCLAVSAFQSRQRDYWVQLDQQEQITATRFKLARLREQYILCHGLLREVIAAHIGISAACLRISRAEFGKPYLPDYPEVQFNMSHSGDCLLIAVGENGPVGVDIEVYKPRETWDGLVRKCFAQEEMGYWRQLGSHQQGEAFYNIWVQKEALVKAVGRGISLGLNQCVTEPKQGDSFLRVPASCGSVGQWQVKCLTFARGIHAAVVSQRQSEYRVSHIN